METWDNFLNKDVCFVLVFFFFFVFFSCELRYRVSECQKFKGLSDWMFWSVLELVINLRHGCPPPPPLPLFQLVSYFLKWPGQKDLPVLKNARYIYLYIYYVYFIYTIYVCIAAVKPYSTIKLNTFMVITLFLLICSESSQSGLYSPDSNCW